MTQVTGLDLVGKSYFTILLFVEMYEALKRAVRGYLYIIADKEHPPIRKYEELAEKLKGFITNLLESWNIFVE